MAKYKIEVDEDVCIGCGACNASCDQSFEMIEVEKKGPKAKATKTDVEELGCALEAAEICPVIAIHITEDGKKLI